MIDVAKQIEYWRRGAEEDWGVAIICLDNDKARHALFFAHLTLEKALKAHVCSATQAVPPKIHNLGRLYDLTALPKIDTYYDVLANINQFNIESRYPEFLPGEPDIETTRILIQQAFEVYQWLMKQ